MKNWKEIVKELAPLEQLDKRIYYLNEYVSEELLENIVLQGESIREKGLDEYSLAVKQYKMDEQRLIDNLYSEEVSDDTIHELLHHLNNFVNGYYGTNLKKANDK